MRNVDSTVDGHYDHGDDVQHIYEFKVGRERQKDIMNLEAEKSSSTFNTKISFSQVIAMLSNLSTSYNVTNISLVLPILSIVYPTAENSARNLKIESFLASSLIFGMMTGQLLGGALGDLLGRRSAIFVVVALQVCCSIGSALIFIPQNLNDESTENLDIGLSIREKLIWWRLVLGIGAGGVYPLAAVLSAEQQPNQSRTQRQYHDVDSAVNADLETSQDQENISAHYDYVRNKQSSYDDEIFQSKMIALTFSTQGIGFLLVPIITLVVVSIWGENSDTSWRVILGLGSAPGLIIFFLVIYKFTKSNNICMKLCTSIRRLSPYYFSNGFEHNNQEELERRLTPPPETNENFVEQNILNHSDMNDNGDLSILKSIKSETNLGTKLLGTAFTWFLFDTLFYGNTIFEPMVVEYAFSKNESSSNTDDDTINSNVGLITKMARDSLFLVALALPGYFISIYKLSTQTPKYIQSQGFFCMFILYLIIGIFWNYLSSVPALLIFLYGGTFFFANYGPNTTTFMLPSKTFTQIYSRSTLNGIAAASGKLGALVGATVFKPVVVSLGASAVMCICGGFSLGGFILTRLFVKEHKRANSNNNGGNNVVGNDLQPRSLD